MTLIKKPSEAQLGAFDLWCGEEYAEDLANEIRRWGRPISDIGAYEISLMNHFYPEIAIEIEVSDAA